MSDKLRDNEIGYQWVDEEDCVICLGQESIGDVITNRPGEIISLCKSHTKDVLVAGLRWNLSQMEAAVEETIGLIIGLCNDDEDDEEVEQ